MKLRYLAIAIVVLLVAGAALVSISGQEEKLNKIDLSVCQAAGCISYDLELPHGSTALYALESVADVEFKTGSLGLYITAIDGLGEDTTQGIYWTYYVDGKMAPASAAAYKIYSDCDLEFRLGEVDWT